ncbi:ABC transporter ATP-binding protein [Brevibacillus borstelensis]|uniref:ABC transporter ATP-binding protein n=1 Tax=Brevibacillus TaxID=55080 RepID=UPI0004F3EB57|nr:ABC transporter ATP-binding protein [Brevibacillus borstelensis]KKX56526.1 peptide ABC transporter ATP-binding protein [Brevibacillus borstelensis cifa_chp40]MCM3468745.1 ABC transporter ATP-binding protein [Brevibacillus borstelensis]MCM3590048.1 ABC transporter ATP-binding protein [Brevibacillus borstelensis]MCM3621745.1 ABC transporter ATP-binding protein [Brevibacillus borstelensis]
MEANLLEVKHLRTHFKTEDGVVPSVNGVSFSVAKGETLAIVGESGCGKSVTSLSIMGLVAPPGEVVGGEIWLEGQNLLALSKKELRKLRGNKLSMIFQEPMTSLNPVFTIGNQLGEVFRQHRQMDKKEARAHSVEMLEHVGIPNAEKIVDSFPHQLSGGMRQRVMIAMALACNPALLIADEPTTALDVTIQAQILELLKKLNKEFQTGVILITHDLGVVAEMADRVVVMYAGEVVEQADVFSLFAEPKHPYTKGLLGSLPKLDENREELDSIPGSVPNPLDMPGGCAFHPRCPAATEECKQNKPQLQEVALNHLARCFYA